MDTKIDGGRAVALSSTGNTSRISTRSTRKKKTTLLTPKKFIDHVMSKNSAKNFEAGTADLYKEIYLESPTFANYFKTSNRERNLSPQVWLYDSTRVFTPDAEYYHASFVEGSRTNQYILAQAPFNPALLKDFLKIVQHTKAEAVVICDASEEASAHLTKKELEKAGAKYSSEKAGDDVLLTTINVPGYKDLKMAKVMRWDANRPSEAEFVDCHEKIRKYIGWSQKGPIVVVCKDGVTKSGIFTLLDIETERLKEKGRVRLTDSVKMLRNCRSNTIDTLDSFEYMCKVIVEMCRRNNK